jgi:hypothetical protein
MDKKGKALFDELFIEATCDVRECDQKKTRYLAREEKNSIFIAMTVASLCNFWAHRRYDCDAKDLSLFIDDSQSSKKADKTNTSGSLLPLPPDSLFESLKDLLEKNVLVIQINRATIVKELSDLHDENVIVFRDESKCTARQWFKDLP